ncbi:mannitol dehydrogenase family protein [bacterium]|nr:mannitol dehydrogenase family protein [bacterium]
MMRLSDATLRLLPAAVAASSYDRSAVRPGIVHLGVGGFHRAHQAVFTDDCLRAGARDWGITAASLRSTATRDALAPQDGLYTLALRENDHQALRVVGAIGRILVAPEDPLALIAAMAEPAVRIVSLTITEKGYGAHVASGDLNLSDAGIQHDLMNPENPQSALGLIAAALRRRRAAGVPPFTLLSCDNLAGNGHVLGRVLGQFASSLDAGFGRFVADTVACPSCMVDRIVPATTDADRAMIAGHLGLQDAWPVMAEPFFQWVIEDRFPSGRPEWERSGVEFTADVAPHEAMKLRLLNGAHTSIAAFGRVAGFATVAEAMANPVVRSFVQAYWRQVGPTIAPGIDAEAYARRLVVRFDNAALNHKCAQIATDTSLKVPQRIVAPLRDLRAAGRPADLPIFALAVWVRSCLGRDEAGRDLVLADPPLQAWAARPDLQAAPEAVARAFCGLGAVFGDLGPSLVPALTAALASIREHGVLAAANLHLNRT